MKKRNIKEIDGKIYIECSKCGEFKEATNEFFDKNHIGYLGLQGCCKVCSRKYQKEYANINRDKIRENSRNFYKSHKDRCKTSAKQWRENNKEYFLDKCREYRNNNKDELKAKRIERDNNKGYVSIHNKTNKLIRKLGIKPTICPICGEKHRIYSHHPNYDKWNEIIFCCQSCHQLIHSGRIEYSEIIDILTFNK